MGRKRTLSQKLLVKKKKNKTKKKKKKKKNNNNNNNNNNNKMKNICIYVDLKNTSAKHTILQALTNCFVLN